MPSYCQQCGAAHDESARFCPKCGKPVGAAAPLSYAERYRGTEYATSSTPPVEVAPARRRVSPIQAVIGIVVLLVIVGAAYFSIAGGLSGTSSPTFTPNVPPVGAIWFGSSFDTGTFALTDTTTTTHVGAPIALVGHLPRSIASGDANVRAWFNGSVVLNQNVSMKGSGNLFGLTLVPFAYAGAFKFEIDDLGGNALASGALTVTP
jgi:hypothetical protein